MAPQSPPHFQTLAFTTLDVFTSTPYSGNPLALIRIPSYLRHVITQSQKQSIAREFNLSETVFLHEQSDPTLRVWDVDIFTTEAELPFAGHPVIGSACYALSLRSSFSVEKYGNGIFRDGVLNTKAGPIVVKELGNGSVSAEIPHEIHIHEHTIGDLNPKFHIPGLSSHPALRKAELSAPIVSIVKGMSFLLVQLENLELLGEVQIGGEELSFKGVLDKNEGWNEGFVAKYYFVVEESASAQGYRGEEVKTRRVRSRMIEVAMEDPATGSAACAMGCWISLKERRSSRFQVEQGVEMGRRSVIGVEVGLDGEGKRVESVRLSGEAVVVMEGSLRI